MNLSQIRPFVLIVLVFVTIGVIALELIYQPGRLFKVAKFSISFMFDDAIDDNNNTSSALLQSNVTSAIIIDECKKPWPDLELYLTLPGDGSGDKEYRDLYLNSLALFWPKRYIKFLVATDGEVNGAPQTANRAIDWAMEIAGVKTRAVFPRRVFPCTGWHKSQWMKFWADNFTTADYVGFVDTDTFFVTRVALNDLFVDGKPIVRPIYGKPKSNDINYWSKAPQRTFYYTGHKEPFNCMTFFPVIVKTAHLRYFRDHIRNHVDPKKTFDQVFHQIVSGNYYSEYNIMCALMWYHFRDDYFWVVNEAEIGWQGEVPGQIRNFSEGNITKDVLRLRPHVAIHPGHGESFEGLMGALRRGVCFSLTDDEIRPAYCAQYPNRTLAVNIYEFQFEIDNFSRRPGTYEAHLRRIAENDKCPHEWQANRLAMLLN